MIVGEAFGEVKDQDLLYQWPFASFSAQGYSRWLTEQLHVGEVPEQSLLWVNADKLVEPWATNLTDRCWRHAVALGQKAHERLAELGYDHHAVAHPQHAKRFNHNQPYELVTLLKELLG